MRARLSFSARVIALALFVGLLPGAPVAAQDNSCRYAFDGECDEPTYCNNGTDSYDCRRQGVPGPNDCFWAYDGECDEPGLGTGVCPAASDAWDCRQQGSPPGPNDCPFAFDGECDEPGIGTGVCMSGTDTADCTSGQARTGDDSCQWAFDGECDEPGIGTGACPPLTDATDCATASARGGNNTCRWAFDLECDHPGLGTGACSPGTDTADCAALEAGGDNSCEWAFDNECDEPGIGLGVCTDGTDTADCAAVAHLRHRDNSCVTAFDDRCDEPGQGTGQCAPRSDTVDCLGRTTVPGIRDHYFGFDERVRLAPNTLPWSAIGEARFESGGSCTATLVAPRIAITAAHCFYSDNVYDPPTEFLAGLNGPNTVARARVVDHLIAPGYEPVAHDETNTVNGEDWGFLVLDRPIDRYAGMLEIYPVSATELSSAVAGGWYPLSQAGYSWDSPEYLTGHLGCRLVQVNGDNTVLHECDTTQGDSGSPIFAELPDGRYGIIAVDSQFFHEADGKRTSYMAVDARAFAAAFNDLLAKVGN